CSYDWATARPTALSSAAIAMIGRRDLFRTRVSSFDFMMASKLGECGSRRLSRGTVREIGVEGPADGLEQDRVVEGLGQKCDGSGAERLASRQLIAVTGDDHDLEAGL